MKKYIYTFNKKWSLITLPIWLALFGVFFACTNIDLAAGKLKTGWVVVREGVWRLPDVLFILIPIAALLSVLLATFSRKEWLFASLVLPGFFALTYESADKVTRCLWFMLIPCIAFAVGYALLCLGFMPSKYIPAALGLLCACYFPLSVALSFVPLLEAYNFYKGASYEISMILTLFFSFLCLGIYCLGFEKQVKEKERRQESYDTVYDDVKTGDALKESSHLRADDDILK